jgi:hypothetical protein
VMMKAVKALPAGRALATCMLTGALAVGISACGSSSSSGSAATGSAGSASTSSTTARYEARLALAKCLRGHGLSVPDPSPNGGAAGGGAGGAGGGGGFRALRDQPNFQSAMQACAKYRSGAFGFGTISPQQRAQFRQDLVKFAECMRLRNISIPDPTTSSGGGFGILRQITPSERSSPAFQSALQACSSNLPFRRGGAPAAGGAAAPGASPGA